MNNDSSNKNTGKDCPIKLVQKIISGKWKILILWYLTEEPRRFGELNRLLPNTSRGVLTEQLKQLEQDGLVHRQVYDEMPLKVVYSLTDIGEGFCSVLTAMGEWAHIYMDKKHSLNNQ